MKKLKDFKKHLKKLQVYNRLITRSNIGLKKLGNDINNISEDEVKNKRLNYLNNLVETIVHASQKKIKEVKNLLHKDSKDKD